MTATDDLARTLAECLWEHHYEARNISPDRRVATLLCSCGWGKDATPPVRPDLALSIWETTHLAEVLASVVSRRDTDLYDESGLPRHLPMGVTAEGEGPTDDRDAHHWICWCNTDCSWNQALAANLAHALDGDTREDAQCGECYSTSADHAVNCSRAVPQ